MDDEWGIDEYDDEYDADLIYDWMTSLQKIIDDGTGDNNKEDEIGSRLFSVYDLYELKKERVLTERKKTGYCRNKYKHKETYAKICEAYSSYITIEIL